MSDIQRLTDLAISLTGKQPSQYGKLKDFYNFGEFTLDIDFVPDDPIRYPVRMRVRVPLEKAKFPPHLFDSESREVAFRDFLARRLAREAARTVCRVKNGRDGTVSIDRPGRVVLESTAVVVGNGFIEARFVVEMPIAKSKIPDPEAVQILTRHIPRIIRAGLMAERADLDAAKAWADTVEDADELRASLRERKLAAFIADGSVPAGRKSIEGDDNAVRFRVPDELATVIDLQNRGGMRGLAVPEGITVLAGGFYQGRSTLIEALAHGVYNHVPGDGRELVVTRDDAMYVGMEPGRSVAGVDVSVLLGKLKSGRDPKRFSTPSADAVESFAANLSEALEAGTSLLLLDEDTIPTGIMSRDPRMAEVTGGDEITPVTVLLAALRERGISVIIATDSPEIAGLADTVILMRNGQPVAAPGNLRTILSDLPAAGYGREPVFPASWRRVPFSNSLEPRKAGKSGFAPVAKGSQAGVIHYGEERIDCSAVKQLVSASQARGISRGISLVRRMADGAGNLGEAVDRVMARVESVGLDTLSNRCMGDLAAFRKHELLAAVNRLSGLRVK